MPQAVTGHTSEDGRTVSSARRDEIVSIAAELFAVQGIQATTVRQIGDRAGILSGSLYHHFRSKLDLVDAILSEFCNQISSLYEEEAVADLDVVTTFKEMVSKTVLIMQANVAAVHLVEAEIGFLRSEPRFGYVFEFLRNSEASWVALLERGTSEGMFRPELDPKLYYALIRYAIAGCVEFVTHASEEETTRAIDALIDLVLNGLI